MLTTDGRWFSVPQGPANSDSGMYIFLSEEGRSAKYGLTVP
jgi:hypothetical protein